MYYITDPNIPTADKVQAIFIGLLGRPALSGALSHYVSAIDGAGAYSYVDMLYELVNDQPEYINWAAGKNRAQIVDGLYQRLFRRAPEYNGGINYWVNGGGSTVPVDELTMALLEGAGTTDHQTVVYKVECAQYLLTDLPAHDPAAQGLRDLMGVVVSGVYDAQSLANAKGFWDFVCDVGSANHNA